MRDKQGRWQKAKWHEDDLLWCKPSWSSGNVVRIVSVEGTPRIGYRYGIEYFPGGGYCFTMDEADLSPIADAKQALIAQRTLFERQLQQLKNETQQKQRQINALTEALACQALKGGAGSCSTSP